MENNISAIPRTEMEKAATAYHKPKYRFHENANDGYEIGSLEDLSSAAILTFIQQHRETQSTRLIQLEDYYKVKNQTIFSRKEREPHLSDVRLAHGYARYISSFIQGYLVGNPIKVKHTTDAVNEAVAVINKTFGADQLNSDIALDLSIYGRAYELAYRSTQDKDRVVRLNPLRTFVIYDDTVETRPLAGVRYKVNLEGNYEVELYTDKGIHYFEQDGADLVELDRKDHYFQEVPITEYANNRFRQGDFEPVLDLIDAYDAAESDTSNYMTDLNDAIMVILGDVELRVEDALHMKEKRLLLLKPTVDGEGKPQGAVDAKYIYKQYDVAGVEAYKNRLQNDIHRFTNTPDMSDEHFSGNSSGESMKYKLFGLDQVRADKETRMIEGLTRRYRLLFNLKSTAQELTGVNAEDLAFIFTPNVPRAFYEELKAFIESGGQLSQETLLTLTALVPDPAKELEKLQAEKATALSAAVKDPYEDAANEHIDTTQQS